MTYKQLLVAIAAMSQKQQHSNVTILVRYEDEYIPVQELLFAGSENDVMDEDHPYLTIE